MEYLFDNHEEQYELLLNSLEDELKYENDIERIGNIISDYWNFYRK